jgi:hypothetical protein
MVCSAYPQEVNFSIYKHQRWACKLSLKSPQIAKPQILQNIAQLNLKTVLKVFLKCSFISYKFELKYSSICCICKNKKYVFADF